MKAITDFAPHIIKTAPVIVLLLDSDGVVVDVNPYFEKLTGFGPAQVQGKKWIENYIPERYRDSIQKTFDDAIHGNPVRGHVNPILTSSGNEIYIEWFSNDLYGEDGDYLGHLAIGQDISERRAQQKEISNMALIINNSQDFIGIADIDGNPLFLNHGGRRLVGISSDEEFRSTQILDYFPESEKEFVKETIIPQVLKSGRWSGEFAFKNFQSGESIPVWFDLFRVDDPITGMPSNFATSSRDLRSQKHTESELAISAKLREQAQIIANLAYLKLTPETGKITGTPLLYKIFGLSPETANLDKFTSLIHPDDKDLVLTAIQHGIEKNLSREIEYRIIRPDGSTRWLHVKGDPIIDADGKVIELIGTYQDITHYKKVTDELNSRKLLLESEVKMRTLELQRMTEEAIAANSAKSEFLSRMSHELRTPLNAILGFGQLLELDKQLLKERHYTNVLEILDAGDHLLKLINGILDMTAVESGNLSINMQSINACNIISQSLRLFDKEVSEKSLTINNRITDKCDCVILSDPFRLKQIFINLFSNAAKFNQPKGSISIECSESNNMTRFTITDTGIGFDETDSDILFAPFERMADHSHIEGSGIGLPLTKSLVEAMGGNIGASSTKGMGSTFWVEFERASRE